MHVQTHTDRNIQASEALTAQVEAAIAGALSRVVDRVTRVEVHLSDENGAKGGADDKRCMMEARLEGRPPTAVLHRAATIEQAISGAVGKLAQAVESVLARAQLLMGRSTHGREGRQRPKYTERFVTVLTRHAVRGLLRSYTPPCVSLYQPTHRHDPDNRQDRIRFRNLLRQIEASLRQRYSHLDDLLAPFRALEEDGAFWNHTLDGLAVLGAPGLFRVFRVSRPVGELALVADTFHLMPLWRVVQSSDRYQVLCVTRQTARVFEGNRDALDELETGTFPADIETALGEQRTEPHQTVASYGTGTGGPGPMYHGHGSRKDELDKDTERYFRAVDRATIKQFSAPSELPLVLTALPEHQPVFRRLSQNTALLVRGVDGDPEAMSAEELSTAAWHAVEPAYLERLARLSNRFRQAVADQRATSDLSDAARAAVEGRVSHLLLEAGRVRSGRLDPVTGGIVDLPLDDPTVGDMLDDLAEMVLRTGGDVVVVPSERMPSDTGLAASFRY